MCAAITWYQQMLQVIYDSLQCQHMLQVIWYVHQGNCWTFGPSPKNTSTHQPKHTWKPGVTLCLAGLIHRLGSHINTHPISNTNAAVVRLFRTGEVQQLLLHVNRISHEQYSSWELIKSAHQLFYSGDRTDHSSLGRALWRILIHFYNIEPVSKLQ